MLPVSVMSGVCVCACVHVCVHVCWLLSTHSLLTPCRVQVQQVAVRCAGWWAKLSSWWGEDNVEGGLGFTSWSSSGQEETQGEGG